MANAVFIDLDGVSRLAAALRRAADDVGHLAGLATHACASAVVPDRATPSLGPLEERLILAASLLEDRVRLAASFRADPDRARGLLEVTAGRTLASWRAERVATATLVLDGLLADRARRLDGHGLTRLRDVLEGLTDGETEAVVAARPTREWRAAFERMRASSGWSARQRRAFFALLGERLTAPTWRRLAAVEPEMEPLFADRVDGLPPRRGDGTDATYGLVEVAGPLASARRPGGPPIEADDAAQGYLGDCSFWAAVQALAHHHPDRLARMLVPNANGSVTVTFADGDRIAVDTRSMGDTVRGDLMFAVSSTRPDVGPTERERWPLALHKAWVVRVGGYGRVSNRDPTETAQALVGGTVADLPRRRLDATDLAARLAAGELVFVETRDLGTPSPDERDAATDGWGLQGNHGYWVVDADPAAATVTLHNPWFTSPGRHLVLAIDDLRREEVGIRVLKLQT